MMTTIVTSVLQRFESKFIKDPVSGCWNWKKPSPRYGQFWVGSTPYLAHRFSYFLYKGNYLKSQYVLHKCDNPACVNPDHLYLGTPKDNSFDRDSKGRSNTPRGFRLPQTKLTNSQVDSIIIDTRKQIEIAKEYGIDPSYVSMLKSKKRRTIRPQS